MDDGTVPQEIILLKEKNLWQKIKEYKKLFHNILQYSP